MRVLNTETQMQVEEKNFASSLLKAAAGCLVWQGKAGVGKAIRRIKPSSQPITVDNLCRNTANNSKQSLNK